MKNIKEIVKVHIALLIIVGVSSLLGCRICVFYNLFKIPCCGCGITRGIQEVLKGNIIGAIRYNYLSIVIVVGYIITLIWSIIDIVNKSNSLENFIKKHKNLIIIITVILVIIAWIININNPLLY